jgi:hypothetical protein
MPTDDLHFGIQNPFLGEIREKLVPKQVRIDPLLDSGFKSVPLDDLSDPSGTELVLPVGLKEVAGSSLSRGSSSLQSRQRRTVAAKRSFWKGNSLAFFVTQSERSE